MERVVGIRFRRAGKVYYFAPGAAELRIGDLAVVETSRGQELGRVVVGPEQVPEEEIVPPLRPVIRKASREDEQSRADNQELENKAFILAQERIRAHNLPMKLINVEYTFDHNKIIFYFAAEGRVDFRALVRDLAAHFHKRIELRQVGVRDAAKMVGGLGCCGRELCCATFLEDFAPVSIRMAKDQSLSLNPGKISGACGRLMCCLKYENEFYEEAKCRYPCSGAEINTQRGKGRVVDRDIFREEVRVELEDKQVVDLPLSQVFPERRN